MQNLPNKNYSTIAVLNQLCLPMDVGVLIPGDDSVRLLIYVLRQLDLSALYEAYEEYGEKRRRAEVCKEGASAQRENELIPANENGGTGSNAPWNTGKKKEGRPPCDILVLLSVVLYAYMERVYSSRAIARACRVNINFMYLLNGSPAPSHGVINTFRKHILGKAIEKLFYEMVKFLERCGELRFDNAFIDGTMLEAQANRYTAVWRKNLDRYEKGQQEKIAGILAALNSGGKESFAPGEGTHLEKAGAAREWICAVLKCGDRIEGVTRKTLKEYRGTLRECVKKLERYRKQREIMGERNSYSKTDTDATFMRMKDETLKAAYNVQIAVEGEYITGAGIFANPNDGTNLKPFLLRLREMLGKGYKNITADAGYESKKITRILPITRKTRI